MKLLLLPTLLLLIAGCYSKKEKFDATGSFETDEVIVSSQLNGQLMTFNINEGDRLTEGQVVATIDSTYLSLQKAQVRATIQSLHEKTMDVAPQIKLLYDQLGVQQSQLNNLLYERARTERLVKADAATGKQLDDLNEQIRVQERQMQVTRQQIAVQRNNTGTQNRSVLSEAEPLREQQAQVEDQLSKTRVVNPVTGIVITKYAENGEITAPGKALYKIGDLSVLTLRAYVSGTQLAQIKLNQPVKVLVDDSANGYRTYNGTITWISDKAEFTPKTIQTKDERANMVYAIKIRVKNDGYLKIGMYAEVKF